MPRVFGRHVYRQQQPSYLQELPHRIPPGQERHELVLSLYSWQIQRPREANRVQGLRHERVHQRHEANLMQELQRWETIRNRKRELPVLQRWQSWQLM